MKSFGIYVVFGLMIICNSSNGYSNLKISTRSSCKNSNSRLKVISPIEIGSAINLAQYKPIIESS